MKINEVEQKAGITKKNIRFYEEQGLLHPKRNFENGYREYGEEEVQTLLRIKVLRKIGVPIEEIRKMLEGTHTVADGMRRHMITLEREKRNLEQSMALCRQLQNLDVPVGELDTELILTQMEEMERGGIMFRNKQTEDVLVRYVAPVIVTVVTVALMIGMIVLVLWASRISPEEAPPRWFVVLTVGCLAAVAVGAVLALLQRIQEIGKGEIDDARHY